MGLDIRAYRKLMPANGNEAFDETGELKYEEGWVQLYKSPDFPGRADEIQDGHAYKYEKAEGFCAGSYWNYNAWRAELSKLAGYPAASACWEGAEGPFSELIAFSDCEGVIGATVSAKLAKDFADFQEKADAHPEDHFRRKYAEWRQAFEMAADGGGVSFH